MMLLAINCKFTIGAYTETIIPPSLLLLSLFEPVREKINKSLLQW